MTEGVQRARVTYREVLQVREFRAIAVAQVLSVLGDQLARLAIAVLVFERTGSEFAASATYACSYLTWVVGGPLLTVLADRRPRATVMIASDLARAVLLLALALPGVPLVGLFGLLLLTGALAPPFEAARSALVGDVLDEKEFLAGNALMNSITTLGHVVGFGVGGAAVAALGVRTALVVDSASFLLSAIVLLALPRPAAPAALGSSTLREDLVEGLVLVRGTPRLRHLLTVGVIGMCLVIAAEGLAVPIAYSLEGGRTAAGLLAAAIPLGYLIGAAMVVRIPLDERDRSMAPLLLLSGTPLILSPFIEDLRLLIPVWVIAGVGSSVQILANSAYVLATPAALRGRAFGLAATLIMLTQAAVLLVAGGLAEAFDGRVVVALLAGLLLPLSFVVAALLKGPAQGIDDNSRSTSG